MGSAFHQLCPRYSGTLTPTATTAIRLWDTFTFLKLFNEPHIFLVSSCTYQHKALDKVQLDDFQSVCYLNCCSHIAKLLYSLTENTVKSLY